MNIHEKINSALRNKNFKEAASLVKDLLASSEELQGRNIRYAHILLLGAEWNAINSLLPKDTNYFLTSGWILSLLNGIPINNDGEPIPWFTYPAIDFLDPIVKKNWKVFEWGSGNSTLWWAAKVSQVYSIEDNENWFDEIKKRVPSNVEIEYCSEKEVYIHAIKETNIDNYDVIVIDGSYRNDCARNAIEHLNEKGIIILDNSDGKNWIDGIQTLRSNGFKRVDFWGLIPSYLYKNCTSVFFKDTSIFENATPPAELNTCTGISCYQAIEKYKT